MLLTTPISIDLSLELEVGIETSLPAIYYPPETVTLFTDVFFTVLVVLHVLALIAAGVVLVYFRLRLMLLVIELCSTMTHFYLYTALALFNVTELAAEASRSLQPFIYPFGQPLSAPTSSFYYFSYTQFILASLVVQLLILLVLVVLKVHSPSPFIRYLHLGFLYAFSG